MRLAIHHFFLLVVGGFLTGCACGPSEMQQCKFSYLGVYHIPPTAREIGPFRRITPTMGMEHIVRIVGYPDALWGSGLYIYAYHLKDGSYVTIGTDGSENVCYVNHGDEFIVGISDEEKAKHGVPRDGCYVPDAETAVRIAEAVCEPIYGRERVVGQRPFEASLNNKSVWVVRGSRPNAASGAVISVEIFQPDSRILRVSYDE
jgi:hypothetical protein